MLSSENPSGVFRPTNIALAGLLAIFIPLFSGQALAAGDPYALLRYYYPVPKANPPQTIETDVCVYGATPAGITAAIQATRMGKSAVLVEFGRHVGGMTSSGLSATDGGRTAAGMSVEFYKVVGKSGFKPAAAEAQFKAMLEKAGVKVFYEHRLASVSKEGPTITQIAMENGNVFKAKMFIDCTYEGDLMAMAKVSYAVGREANSQYMETLDGIHKPGAHNFTKVVDPYVVPGDPKSGVLPRISNTAADAPGVLGAGDKRVQAYNFRMYLAKMPGAIAFPKPPGYDPRQYELLLRYLLAGATTGSVMQLHAGDSNNNGGFSTDNIGMSDNWPDGTYEQREKIYQDHVTYQQGFMYFLANDPRVPEKTRTAVASLGLAEGNFEDTGGWPHQLYVREGRRVVSDYVMTEHNCLSEIKAEDSIGLGEYNMDSHNCQRFISHEDGVAHVKNEGDVQHHIPHPYPVSYRSMVPKEAECTNLFVPVCLSATHIAYGSIRMEPVFMVLGQSAATAAGMAIDAKIPVQKVDYAKLRERLIADGQNLEWSGKLPAAPAGHQPKKAGTKRIVCFGDSITQQGYPAVLGELLGVDVVNAGIGGQSTGQALPRMQKDVIDEKPDAVVILFGTNDSRLKEPGVYVPVDKYEANLTSMIDQCEAAGAKVVICTIPPIKAEKYFTRHSRVHFNAAGGFEKVLGEYRAAAIHVAEVKKTGLVNLGEELAKAPDSIGEDGVHPSPKGKELIAKLVADVVGPMVLSR
jgi:lysophospholipase L1-like esterase